MNNCVSIALAQADRGSGLSENKTKSKKIRPANQDTPTAPIFCEKLLEAYAQNVYKSHHSLNETFSHAIRWKQQMSSEMGAARGGGYHTRGWGVLAPAPEIYLLGVLGFRAPPPQGFVARPMGHGSQGFVAAS